MNAFDLSEFTEIRTVYYESHEHGGGWGVHEFEARMIELHQRGSEYYLLYWYDPLPGGYGDKRCEGIVHINETEAKKDDRQLTNLYFDTKVRPLINMELVQEKMTLTCLSAGYSADRICFAYCASESRGDRYEGCIEVTRNEMDYMTEKRLTSALKKVVPAGTVIPEFTFQRKRKHRHNQ